MAKAHRAPMPKNHVNLKEFVLIHNLNVRCKMGAVICQEQDGKEVTIAYWSKTLNPAQRNYCTTHRELLALVESIKAFNHYLAGAPFIVRSDHAALQWLKNFKNPTGMLARWLEKLAPYQFQVVHVKGSAIGHADALSRRPNRPCQEDCKKCSRLEERERISINRVDIENFHLIHKIGSLMDSPPDLPIIHAVSEDGEFGAGLSKQIEEVYSVKKEFREKVQKYKESRGNCPLVAVKRDKRTIINVITKKRYFDKPTPMEVKRSLEDLKRWLDFFKIKEWCLPEFSCGRDQLDYDKVIDFITEIFGKSEMTIYMYHLHGQHCKEDCKRCLQFKIENLRRIYPDENNIKVFWTTIVPDGVEPEQMRKIK